eukprot:11430698-Alexandrium_andersonii.AAC.1
MRSRGPRGLAASGRSGLTWAPSGTTRSRAGAPITLACRYPASKRVGAPSRALLSYISLAAGSPRGSPGT